MTAKYTRILSIDGGGIRGIIPGQILVALEQKLQASSGNAEARLADHFDLIAGTSTGGILACIYLCPGADGRPKFTAADAVELYTERGGEVFDIPLFHRIRTAAGLLDEKYPATGLEAGLLDYLGEQRLSDLLRDCLITAYDIERRATVFFTRSDGGERDFRLRDVARATSAAPTFFEAAQIHSPSNQAYPLIDGGVFANNPAMCAYAEARKLEARPTAKEMVIVSLGTGKIEKPYDWNDAKDYGPIGWVRPVIDIMMTGVAETVDYQLVKLFDAADAEGQYRRIQPSLRKASPDMDDATPENVQALREAGDQAAQENSDLLDEIVSLLLEEKASP